jgi:hypothetical protein
VSAQRGVELRSSGPGLAVLAPAAERERSTSKGGTSATAALRGAARLRPSRAAGSLGPRSPAALTGAGAGRPRELRKLGWRRRRARRRARTGSQRSGARSSGPSGSTRTLTASQKSNDFQQVFQSHGSSPSARSQQPMSRIPSQAGCHMRCQRDQGVTSRRWCSWPDGDQRVRSLCSRLSRRSRRRRASA